MRGLIRCEQDGAIYRWRAATIWEAARLIPAEQLPLALFESLLDRDLWFQHYEVPTIRNVMRHWERVESADLSYPVILAPSGAVLDGTHRIIKAFTLRHATVLAVRLPTYPPSDFHDDGVFLEHPDSGKSAV
ncbi:MAG: hypothetical protein OHK0022_15100 [Roseiflexaceae bacterium]